jgi:hypothetical protein
MPPRLEVNPGGHPMRVANVTVLVSGVVLLLLCSPSPAPAASDTDNTAVRQALADACKAGAVTGPYCTNQPSVPLAWLVLSDACPETSAEAFCATFAGVKAKTNPAVLAYNHATGQWRLRPGADKGTRMTRDENGVPTLSVSGAFAVIVERTNPVVYRATVDTVTVAPIGILDDLRLIVSGLGAFIAGALKTIGPDGPPVIAGVDGGRSLPDVFEPLLRDLVAAYAELAKARETLGAAIETNSSAARAFVACAQQLEFEVAHNCQHLAGTNLPQLESLFEAIHDGQAAVESFYAPHQALLTAFAKFVDDSEGTNGVSGLSYFLFQQAVRMVCSVSGPACEEARALEPFADHLYALAGQPAEEVKKSKAMAASRIARDFVKSLDPAAVLTAANGVISKRGDAVKASYVTRQGLDRVRAFSLSTGLMSWFWVEPPSDSLNWEKLYTYSVSLKADTPFKDQLTLLHSDTTIQYKTRSARASALAVSVGVIYTKLSDETYGLVSDPADAEKKRIAVTDANTRSGQLALFADYRFLAPFIPASEGLPARAFVQLGTGLTSTPAAFVGGGVELFKVLRLSGGGTWQKLSVLNPQEQLDQIAAAESDIKKKDQFTPGGYVALSFALDSLALFSKPK